MKWGLVFIMVLFILFWIIYNTYTKIEQYQDFVYKVEKHDAYYRVFNAAILYKNNRGMFTTSKHTGMNDPYLYIFYRASAKNELMTSDIMYNYIDMLNKVVSKPKLLLKHSNNISREDPRVTVLKKRQQILISYTYCQMLPNNKLIVQMRISLLSMSLEIIQYDIKLKNIGDDNNIEKNWVFFEAKNQLYCIYKVNPYILYTIDLDNKKAVLHSMINLRSITSLNKTDLRASSIPIRINDMFYMVVHTKNYDQYMIQISPQSMLPVMISEKLFDCKYKICYVSGLVYDKTTKSFLISMGINDEYITINQLFKSEINYNDINL